MPAAPARPPTRRIIPPGSLAFGLQLPVQSLSTRFAEPWEDAAGVDELVAVARACDVAGLFYVAVCDHVAIPRDRAEEMSTAWWDTVATLAYLAACTERVRLLSHVYVPAYRHPLVVAKAWSTLDALSGGRAVLGVGAGHLEGEFEALGVDFASRGRALDDAIDAVRAAFADEFGVDGMGQRPRPVQPGGPPIWIGGSSPAALRRAVDRGDGWLPQGPPAQGMRPAVAMLREARGAAFAIGVNVEAFYLGEPGFALGPHDRAGTAEQLTERLDRYRALGVDHVQLRFRSRSAAELVDQIERFGAEVAPEFAGGGDRDR